MNEEVDLENMEDEYDSKKLYRKKLKILIVAIIGLVITIFIFISVFTNKKPQEEKDEIKIIKMAQGNIASDTEKLWRYTIEENLNSQNTDLTSKLEELKQELLKQTQDGDIRKEKEIRDLRDKLQFLQAELEESKGNEEELKIEADLVKLPKISRYNVNLSNGKNSQEYEPLKTADNYIASGSFVKGVLLNGLNISTSIKTVHDPEPILIRLTDHGRLPRKFKSDLKDCHIIASAYGELSSESAKIRIEKLSCTEIKTGEVVETEIAGYIVGEDGVAGLRGTVVSIDQKYLANAQIFGTLSGFTKNVLKDAADYNPFTIGMGAVKPLTGEQKIKNSAIGGTSSSLDRLAEYYIDRAESVQPVIQIAAGREIDVVFTEGVYFGTSELKKSLAKKRDVKIKNLAASENHYSNNLSLTDSLEDKNE